MDGIVRRRERVSRRRRMCCRRPNGLRPGRDAGRGRSLVLHGASRDGRRRARVLRDRRNCRLESPTRCQCGRASGDANVVVHRCQSFSDPWADRGGDFNGRSVVLEFSCPTVCAGSASLHVSRLDTFLRDVDAPVVGIDAPGQSLRFSDVGGGVESSDLEVDGESRSLAVGGEACRRPFAATIPCALGEVALADLGLGPGEHSVFATLVDAAGNRTYSGPHLFRIDPPPALGRSRKQPRGVVIVAGEKRRRITDATTTVGGIGGAILREEFSLGGAQMSVS